ncbi:autotransporter outer membrane beta-barrel domain-containing protein [Stenotrophomonas maltophilia]|uniref:autotransporter family protein n=1 Tax=Stenotrophomonas maltophilia TaxID=40324 RepID=UPI003D7E2E47
MRNNPLGARRLLFLSISIVLSAPMSALAHGPVVVENGTHIDLSDEQISSSANLAHGVLARTSGTATLKNTDILTTGDNAFGSAVVSADSWIDLDGGSISTQGRGSYALYSAAGVIQGRNLDISTSAGSDSIGVLARGADAAIDLTESRVIVSGNAHAAAATGGALLRFSGVSLIAGDNGGNGVTARDVSTGVYINSSSIAARGSFSHGVLATDGAHLDIKDSHITASGDRGRGVWATGQSTVLIDSSRIDTSGDSSLDGGGSISFGAAAVVASTGAEVSLNDSIISTSGYAAGGLNAEYSGSQITMNGGSIHTTGERSRGATASGGDNLVNLQGVNVLSEGAMGQGVAAGDAGSRLNMVDSVVETRGSEGAGVYGRDEGVVSILRSTVSTHGEAAVGADLRTGAQLFLDGSEIRSASSSSLQLDGAFVTASQGSVIEGGNGILANFASDDANHITLDSASLALGDILFSNGARDVNGNGVLDRTSSVSIDNGSHWSGATDAVGELSLANGSRWSMTGSSEVGSLSLVNSEVAFDHADGLYKTLTLDGDFHADSALLVMNTTLGDDSSQTDFLHVKGNTSGNARVAVNNVGGGGAQTENGIKLIQVDGVSAGQYTLAGRAVGGAYEYFLYQGGRGVPGDGDWYLRSELPLADQPLDPCADGTCIIDPPASPVPVLRPEAGAYLANQASALGLFNMSLHQRVGEPNLAQRQRGDSSLGSAWARVISTQPRYHVGGQLNGQGRQNTMQIGSDLTFWGAKDRGVIGVMAASGQATNRVASSLTDYGAEGRLDGKALGVYATWIQGADNDGGLYVDSWLQSARFKGQVQGNGLAAEIYRSRSFSASLEAGYALLLRESANSAVYLEPQVQAIWTDYSMDGGEHKEGNGTIVKVAREGALQTRLGMRVYGHSTAPSGNRIQPFVGVNWVRNTTGANAVWLDDQRLQGITPRNLYEVKVGAELQLSRRLTGWGELNAQHGDYGFRSIGGQVGVKYAW